MTFKEYEKLKPGEKLYHINNDTVVSFIMKSSDHLAKRKLVGGNIIGNDSYDNLVFVNFRDTYKDEKEAYLTVLNNLQRKAEDCWIKSKQYKKQFAAVLERYNNI